VISSADEWLGHSIAPVLQVTLRACTLISPRRGEEGLRFVSERHDLEGALLFPLLSSFHCCLVDVVACRPLSLFCANTTVDDHTVNSYASFLMQRVGLSIDICLIYSTVMRTGARNTGEEPACGSLHICSIYIPQCLYICKGSTCP
jgi:hypothetical protein